MAEVNPAEISAILKKQLKDLLFKIEKMVDKMA
mgnify:CR=1 FL=1